ncbi:MAG: GDSL-type esterase/lipase family protein [Verrucomicrobia bacterium]|nr:GDSL-type esterase/lipase family protein [Verrucomicrobiota bacterium]
MSIFHCRSLLFRAGFVSFLLVCAPTLFAAEKSPSQRWEKEITAFEIADKKNPPPQEAILFIGSSSIRRWKTLAHDFPGHTIINRGFGGSQIADATRYADRIIIPCKPRLIVLGAGSNDINAGKSPEQVAADFEAFVVKVRAALPDTRIAFMSINPAPVRAAQLGKQRKANQLIKQYVAAGNNLDYINIFDAFLGPDGQPREDLFVADRLHHNAAGYEVRVKITRLHLGPTAKSDTARGKSGSPQPAGKP